MNIPFLDVLIIIFITYSNVIKSYTLFILTRNSLNVLEFMSLHQMQIILDPLSNDRDMYVIYLTKKKKRLFRQISIFHFRLKSEVT